MNLLQDIYKMFTSVFWVAEWSQQLNIFWCFHRAEEGKVVHCARQTTASQNVTIMQIFLFKTIL